MLASLPSYSRVGKDTLWLFRLLSFQTADGT